MHKKTKLLLSLMIITSILTCINVKAENVSSNTSVTGRDGKVKINNYLILDEDALLPDFLFTYTVTGLEEIIPATENQEEVLAPSSTQIPQVGSSHYRPSDYVENIILSTTAE